MLYYFLFAIFFVMIQVNKKLYIVEFFREPDAQLGYYFGYFTMGQILCFLMMIGSYFMLMYAKKINIKNPLINR